MFEFLEKLRQKPDGAKKQIAFLFSFFLVGIIFVVWLSIIYPDFRQDAEIEKTVPKLEPSPLETFKNTFKTGTSAIGEQISKLKGTITEITTDLATSTVATSTEVQ